MTKTLKKGFTLVELIVVIAIIAILATVSVVGYSAFIENANKSKVNQELAQAENVLRAEAVETVTVSLQEGTPVPTLVMSLDGSKIKFTFTHATSDDVQKLLDALIEEVELSALEGNFTLTQDGQEVELNLIPEVGEEVKLNYTLDDLSATLDVVLVVVVPEPVVPDPEN